MTEDTEIQNYLSQTSWMHGLELDIKKIYLQKNEESAHGNAVKSLHENKWREKQK